MATFEIVGGLDPSLSNFGMSRGCLIRDEAGDITSLNIEEISLVTTAADKSTQYKNIDDLRRARELGKGMMEFFDGVDVIYAEIPVGSQSARAMASYGVCIGVLAALGKRVIRVSAKDVKLAATGNPGASKRDMIIWATNKYPHLPWSTQKRKGALEYINSNEHVADSISAIHAGLKIPFKSES